MTGRTQEGRQSLRDHARQRWQDPEFRERCLANRWGGGKRFTPPAGLEDMYRDLCFKVNRAEAQFLVTEHAAILARRAAAKAT